MLTSVDIHSSVAVYKQIENHVQFAIASGKLKPGDRLPSLHELAERFGVNINTILKAYRNLEVMGLLYSRRGMGVFVNKNIETKCREDCRKRIIDRLHEAVGEAKMAGMSKKEVVDVIEASLNADSKPGEATPTNATAMVKQKKVGK